MTNTGGDTHGKRHENIHATSHGLYSSRQYHGGEGIPGSVAAVSAAAGMSVMLRNFLALSSGAVGALAIKDGLAWVNDKAVVMGDVLIYAHKVTTVQVDKFAAGEAFQVEMLMARLPVVDILVASAGFAVEGVLPHHAGLYQFIELAVDSSRTQGRTFFSEVSADFLNVVMFMFIFYEKVQQFFFLPGIVTRISFHIL